MLRVRVTYNFTDFDLIPQDNIARQLEFVTKQADPVNDPNFNMAIQFEARLKIQALWAKTADEDDMLPWIEIVQMAWKVDGMDDQESYILLPLAPPRAIATLFMQAYVAASNGR